MIPNGVKVSEVTLAPLDAAERAALLRCSRRPG